jgi:hypothetical protein
MLHITVTTAAQVGFISAVVLRRQHGEVNDTENVFMAAIQFLRGAAS